MHLASSAFRSAAHRCQGRRTSVQVAQAAVPGDDEQTEGGLQREHVAFGEVAHAPPKATLKRRHWDEAQAAAAHQARHKEVLLKHLRKAEARQADPEASLHASLQVRFGLVQPVLLQNIAWSRLWRSLRQAAVASLYETAAPSLCGGAFPLDHSSTICVSVSVDVAYAMINWGLPNVMPCKVADHQLAGCQRPACVQAQRDQVVRDRVQGAYRKMKGSRMEGANMHSLKQLVHRRHD